VITITQAYFEMHARVTPEGGTG